MDRHAIVHLLQQQVSGLLAVHAFGSRIHGDTRPGSGLDLAVRVAGNGWPFLCRPRGAVFMSCQYLAAPAVVKPRPTR